MVTKCLVVNRWCCANLRPVFMLSSALLMSLVLSFVLCLGSTFSVLRLCGQKQQSAKQPTNHNTTVQTALQNKIFFILMSTSNEGTVISHSPTASPAVPACVPSQLASGRWYLGALRRKRPLLCWRRFHLRSVDSAASGFPPVSSAPGVMRQTASQLRIFCMDFICPNEHTHTHLFMVLPLLLCHLPLCFFPLLLQLFLLPLVLLLLPWQHTRGIQQRAPAKNPLKVCTFSQEKNDKHKYTKK